MLRVISASCVAVAAITFGAARAAEQVSVSLVARGRIICWVSR
ncbi:MAG: hypothetical protein WKF75_01525 [Singulisphaera sp.]